MIKSSRKVSSVSVGMHYATLTALIVSNLTVLALATLFSGTLVGQPLGEIDAVQYQIKAQRAGATVVSGLQARNRLAPRVAVSLENTFKQRWQVGDATYYAFSVKVKNTGAESFKGLMMTFGYDRSIFSYVVPSTRQVSTNDRRSGWFWGAQPAHAQVSIDFPVQPQDPRVNVRCYLNTTIDPAECDLTARGDTLRPGATWSFDIVLRRIDPSAYRPGMIERIAAWFMGRKAAAQVSIDFPGVPTTTFTTAAIVRAVTVTDVNPPSLPSSTAVAPL